MITLEELTKKQREKKSYRKAEYDLQWDMSFWASCVAQNLRIGAGLTQKQMAKRTKIHQPSLARAEAYGCSMTMLAKIAKAVGKKIVIKVEEPEILT